MSEHSGDILDLLDSQGGFLRDFIAEILGGERLKEVNELNTVAKVEEGFNLKFAL
jgi:hypothetical protein